MLIWYIFSPTVKLAIAVESATDLPARDYGAHCDPWVSVTIVRFAVFIISDISITGAPSPSLLWRIISIVIRDRKSLRRRPPVPLAGFRTKTIRHAHNPFYRLVCWLVLVWSGIHRILFIGLLVCLFVTKTIRHVHNPESPPSPSCISFYKLSPPALILILSPPSQTFVADVQREDLKVPIIEISFIIVSLVSHICRRKLLLETVWLNSCFNWTGCKKFRSKVFYEQRVNLESDGGHCTGDKTCHIILCKTRMERKVYITK